MNDRRNLGRTIREDFEQETGIHWRPLRWTIYIVSTVIIIALLGWGVGWLTQPLRTAAGVRERVADPGNALFQYEKFHDACGAIVTYDKQHKIAQDAADKHDKRTEGKPDPIGRIADESDRLHQVADGIQMARQSAAEQYNADSRKWTQDLFKSKSLPYRIGDETPQCDA